MTRPVLAALACVALAQTAHAQVEVQGAERARYRDCLARSEAEPVEAYEDALAWIGAGGEEPARHCTAIALLRIGHEEEAATRLEALATDMPEDAPGARAEYLRQAASAWLLAGALDRAETAASAALSWATGDADLHLLRAQIRLEAEDYPGAQGDLDQALAGRPDNAEALIMRTHAKLGQGALTDAQADAEAAIAADPESVEARLALGDVREAIRGSSASLGDAEAPAE